MSSTEKCVEMLVEEMKHNLSPSFDKLIMGGKEKWKRVAKFQYGGGLRRYFYLLESCLIATIDERKPTPEELKEIEAHTQEIVDMLTEAGRLEDMPDIKEEDPMMVKIVVRPPMMWEQYMLKDARGTDEFVQDNLWDLWEEYYDFCEIESANGSEPAQYTFEVGPDNGGWIFFQPIRANHYDSHLTSDLDPILPDWLKNQEVQECTYAIDEHPLWTMNCGGELLGVITKELTELGFIPCKEPNYAKCV